MAEEEENLEAEIVYPITCGDSRASLIWRKFVCPGINVKCVQVRAGHGVQAVVGAGAVCSGGQRRGTPPRPGRAVAAGRPLSLTKLRARLGERRAGHWSERFALGTHGGQRGGLDSPCAENSPKCRRRYFIKHFPDASSVGEKEEVTRPRAQVWVRSGGVCRHSLGPTPAFPALWAGLEVKPKLSPSCVVGSRDCPQ